MINRFFKLRMFFASLLSIGSLISPSGGFCSAQESGCCCHSSPLFELKAGYFRFSDSKMRKIYDRGGSDIQLCASYPFGCSISGWGIDAYGAVEYFHRSGKSINGHQKTSLRSIPINIGLKPVYNINSRMQYYFAIGPRYFYLRQHNHSSYVCKNKSRNGLGLFVNTGFNYFLCERFTIDIFGEYSYAKIRFHSGESRVYTRNIQIGGFTFGGGLGWKF